MQMAWPFNKKAEEPQMANDPEVKPTETKTPEKSIAEMLSESLTPFREEFAAIRRDIETLKTPIEPKRTVPAERISVLDDEDAAFNQRMTPILQSQLELEARINVRDVKQEYVDAGFGSIWSQNEGEINKTLEGTALVQADNAGGFKKLRGDAQYIRNVADMIIGRAAKAGGVRFDGTKKTFFLEGSNGDNGTGASRTAETEGLTAKQVKLAQRMGIPLDKMKKTVSGLEFVS
jgi:hypothetical protein